MPGRHPEGVANQYDTSPKSSRFGRGVELSLLEALGRRVLLRLRFNQSDRHRLWTSVGFEAKGVIHAPFGLLTGDTRHNLNRTCRLFTADEVLRPAACIESRVNEFGPSVCFVKCQLGKARMSAVTEPFGIEDIALYNSG